MYLPKVAFIIIWEAVLAETHYLSLMINELSSMTIHLSLINELSLMTIYSSFMTNSAFLQEGLSIS